MIHLIRSVVFAAAAFSMAVPLPSLSAEETVKVQKADEET